MKKIICDFCKKNTATRLYKVKQKVLVPCWKYDLVFSKLTWVKKDICKECYEKLFKGEKDGIR